ncbi:MAG: hypothetical protein ACI4CY_00660 [Candidatus Gastranaerophilaceae bacterium]
MGIGDSFLSLKSEDFKKMLQGLQKTQAESAKSEKTDKSEKSEESKSKSGSVFNSGSEGYSTKDVAESMANMLAGKGSTANKDDLVFMAMDILQESDWNQDGVLNDVEIQSLESKITNNSIRKSGLLAYQVGLAEEKLAANKPSGTTNADGAKAADKTDSKADKKDTSLKKDADDYAKVESDLKDVQSEIKTTEKQVARFEKGVADTQKELEAAQSKPENPNVSQSDEKSNNVERCKQNYESAKAKLKEAQDELDKLKEQEKELKDKQKELKEAMQKSVDEMSDVGTLNEDAKKVTDKLNLIKQNAEKGATGTNIASDYTEAKNLLKDLDAKISAFNDAKDAAGVVNNGAKTEGAKDADAKTETAKTAQKAETTENVLDTSQLEKSLPELEKSKSELSKALDSVKDLRKEAVLEKYGKNAVVDNEDASKLSEKFIPKPEKDWTLGKLTMSMGKSKDSKKVYQQDFTNKSTGEKMVVTTTVSGDRKTFSRDIDVYPAENKSETKTDAKKDEAAKADVSAQKAKSEVSDQNATVKVAGNTENPAAKSAGTPESQVFSSSTKTVTRSFNKESTATVTGDGKTTAEELFNKLRDKAGVGPNGSRPQGRKPPEGPPPGDKPVAPPPGGKPGKPPEGKWEITDASGKTYEKDAVIPKGTKVTIKFTLEE